MTPASSATGGIFLPQPKAGSGLRIAAQQGWAPGNASVVVLAHDVPPGSGPVLSERDRRLATRHEERRRRKLHGPQEGPADKTFQDRELERQAFQREINASKQSTRSEGGRGSGSNGEEQSTEIKRAASLQTVAPVAGGNGSDGRSLAAALDQKAIDRASREAKYEQKRQRYLAAKRGSASEEPRVRFREEQDSDPVVSGFAPATAAATRQGGDGGASTGEHGYQERAVLREPQLRAEKVWPEGINGPPDVSSQERQRSHDPEHTPSIPPAQVVRSPSDQARSSKQQADRQSPTAPAQMKAEYARQLREQMAFDASTAQHTRENARRPPPSPFSQGLSSASHTGILGRGGDGVAVVDGGGGSVDRKAEYARQLREQMAADGAARRAMDSERKGSTAPAVPVRRAVEEDLAAIPGREAERDRENIEEVATNSKAEYARQLREQMAARENARRAEGRREHSPSAAAGPAWIEGATDGREARRRRSNAEYAEKLRAQIAAQRSGNQQGRRVVSQDIAPGDEHQLSYEGERYGQRSRSSATDNAKSGRKGSERSQLGNIREDRLMGGENEHGEWSQEGGRRATASQGRVHDYAAEDRKRQVDRQQEYAEALRRDMAVPKIDPLGRRMDDNSNANDFSDRHGGPREGYRHPGQQGQSASDPAAAWRQQQPLPPGRARDHSPDSTWPSQHQRRGWPGTGDGQTPTWQLDRQRPPVPETRYDEHAEYQRPYPGGYSTAHGWGQSYATAAGDERMMPTGPERPRGGGVPRVPPWEADVRHQSEGRRGMGSWVDHGESPEPVPRAVYTRGGVGLGGGRNMSSTGGDQAERTWRDGGGGDGYHVHAPLREQSVAVHRGQHNRYLVSGDGHVGSVPPTVPVAAVGVSTRASSMHNPVDLEELARIQAKKDAYRRDLESQMAERKKQAQRRKSGEPGSKEAEVFLLQEAMGERNELNKIAPGYEIGPLGVPVLKDNYSTTGRGQRSPPKTVAPVRASPPSVSTGPASPGRPAVPNEGQYGDRVSLPSEGDAVRAEVPRRGSGLRELLGKEATNDKGKENSRLQAEALKKQVEENKARRDSEKALLEQEEIQEEARLQKEREQMQKMYEQEGKAAKAIASEKLFKEAEMARLAAAARKEAAAAKRREEEKREDEKVAREQKELENKYARERAKEQPLGQVSSDSPIRAEIPVPLYASPSRIRTPRKAHLVDTQPISGRKTGAAQAQQLAGTQPTPERPSEATQAQQLVDTQLSPRRTSEAAPTRVLGDSSNREVSTTTLAPLPTGSYGEVVSIEKLQAELWKQKQLTEVLRYEVGQQEGEKRKLLDIARCAKESEAAVLRAAYERRASEQANREAGKVAGTGNNLWRVPPPAIDVKGGGSASTPNGRKRSNVEAVLKEDYSGEPNSRRRDMDETLEDRLLLAGLRRARGTDETPDGGGEYQREDLGGDSTFRERVPGARAWSSGTASRCSNAGERSLPVNFDEISPRRVRAESRYVFPDGSVRRDLEKVGVSDVTKIQCESVRDEFGDRIGGGGRDGSVPLPLVGTSRINSADISAALGIDALGGGAGAGVVSGVGDEASADQPPGRRRRAETTKTQSGGAYRGPGAAAGASWAPGGRPPRAFVPFLNLPSFDGKAGSGKGRRRREQEGNDAKYSGLPSFPFGYSGEGHMQRERPLAGIGGVPVSPQRAMLTGPGRPGTGTSGSSSRVFGDTESGDGHRRRHRRGGSGSGRNRGSDGEMSDGGDSVGSGSTDVEFLRRRAEAKLMSLQRREAAELSAAEEELDALVNSSARSDANGCNKTGAVKARRQPPGGVTVPTNHIRRTLSTASSRSQLYSSRRRRPGTNQSEGSMLGDSRWAMLQAN